LNKIKYALVFRYFYWCAEFTNGNVNGTNNMSTNMHMPESWINLQAYSRWMTLLANGWVGQLSWSCLY